jgi:hypothetical protein
LITYFGRLRLMSDTRDLINARAVVAGDAEAAGDA